MWPLPYWAFTVKSEVLGDLFTILGQVLNADCTPHVITVTGCWVVACWVITRTISAGVGSSAISGYVFILLAFGELLNPVGIVIKTA